MSGGGGMMGVEQINRDSPLFQVVAMVDSSFSFAGQGLSLFICGEFGL
jgi:hypothetical protein